MCFGLNNNLDVKDGQIAHLDRNRANIDIDNLAYLCLDCHKAYDRSSNRVLGYTAEELSRYRLKLYLARREDTFEWTITVRAHRSQYKHIQKSVIEAQRMLQEAGPEVSVSEAPVN